LFLAACVIDSGLNPKDDQGGFDTGDPPDSVPIDTDETDPPPDEACNGVDDNGDGVVDEGYPDDDGNGRVDCLDVACPTLDAGVAGEVSVVTECEGGVTVTPVADPWDVSVEWTFTRSSGGMDQSATTPVVGNLDDDDGDGDVDEDDSPDVVSNLIDSSFSNSAIVAIDGATGVEKWSWRGAGYASGVAIADVDADGYADVLGYDTNYHVVALEGDGTVKWRTSVIVGSVSNLPLVTVADLDNDGRPEVLAYDTVLDGATGAELFTLGSGGEVYAITAVGDVDLDGDQEIAFAGALYDSDGTLLWDSRETGAYGFWPIIIQADSDPEAEIGFVGSLWTLWEHDGSRIYRRNYGTAQPGPPCAGDFDGDGVAEVAWGAASSFVAYELDGSQVWSVPMDDSSGLAGCSGYDVDGTGGLEILFADQSTFKIFDGATGATNYSTNQHSSGTAFEYPSVADIDRDGAAEILFASNDVMRNAPNAITALGHGGAGWPPAGETWAIHDFAITNIEPDGTVPASPDPYWNVYNVYRARVAADHPATPDLSVEITDVCVADCDYGPVQVSAQVWNQGGSDVAAGTTLSLYAIEAGVPRLVGSASLPLVPAGESIDGVVFELTVADVTSEGWQAVVDDGDALPECDESNNTDSYEDTICP
jgi:hypothetical protein